MCLRLCSLSGVASASCIASLKVRDHLSFPFKLGSGCQQQLARALRKIHYLLLPSLKLLLVSGQLRLELCALLNFFLRQARHAR